MVTRQLDDLIGKEFVTQDAYIIGETQDVRYDATTWDVKGLKIKTTKDVAELINVNGKSMILMEPADYTVNHVILASDGIESARQRIRPDSDGIPSVKYLIGKKVFTSDGAAENLLVGTIDSIDIDVDKWHVLSLVIKVDGKAYETLEIKKGLFGGKRISGIQTSDILSVTESVALNISAETLKERMVVL